MRTRSGKVAIWHETPFRLMDLPPELRTRVFDFATSFDTPVMFAFVNITELLLESSWADTPEERVHGRHARRRQGHGNKLTLLLVSRQVNSEAKPPLLRNMKLDLQGFFTKSISHKLYNLPKVWGQRLQYVRSVEIDVCLGKHFLFTGARAAAQILAGRGKILTYLQKTAIKAIFRIRALLFDLHSITFFNGDGRDSEIETILIRLTAPTTRWNCYRMFPRLQDIVVTNDCGTERFTRLSTGGWARFYSKEKLGLYCRRPLQPGTIQRPLVHDMQTGLSSEGIVRLLGPEPSEIDEANHRAEILRLGM